MLLAKTNIRQFFLLNKLTNCRMEEGKTRTYRQHPFSERLKVVELYERGYGSKWIGRTMGLDDSLVRGWLRKYRARGLGALRPYSRSGESGLTCGRACAEKKFQQAYEVYSSSLEPVASIARRYQLDYHAFRYHVERYHPELKARRASLKQLV